MITWKTGHRMLPEKLRSDDLSLELFLESLLANPLRITRTAIFLISNPNGVSHTLLHNLAHNQVLHKCVIFPTVEYLRISGVSNEQRINVKSSFIAGCYQIKVRYGFKEGPNLSMVSEKFRQHGFELELLKTYFFLSEIVVPTLSNGMTPLQEPISSIMGRNDNNAAEYFNLSADRVLELGTRIEI